MKAIQCYSICFLYVANLVSTENLEVRNVSESASQNVSGDQPAHNVDVNKTEETGDAPNRRSFNDNGSFNTFNGKIGLTAYSGVSNFDPEHLPGYHAFESLRSENQEQGNRVLLHQGYNDAGFVQTNGSSDLTAQQWIAHPNVQQFVLQTNADQKLPTGQFEEESKILHFFQNQSTISNHSLPNGSLLPRLPSFHGEEQQITNTLPLFDPGVSNQKTWLPGPQLLPDLNYIHNKPNTCHTGKSLQNIISHLLTLLLESVKGNSPQIDDLNQLLDMLNNEVQTGGLQNSELYPKLQSLEAQLETNPVGGVSNENTKLNFKNTIPRLDEEDCKTAFLKLMKFAYNGYVQAAKHPNCKPDPFLTTQLEVLPSEEKDFVLELRNSKNQKPNPFAGNYLPTQIYPTLGTEDSKPAEIYVPSIKHPSDLYLQNTATHSLNPIEHQEHPLEPQSKDAARQGDIEIEPEARNRSDIIKPTPKALSRQISVFEKKFESKQYLHNPAQPHYLGLIDQPQQYQEEFPAKVPNDIDKNANNPTKEQEISFESLNDDRPTTINKNVMSLHKSPPESQSKDVARQGDIEIEPEDRNRSDTIQPTPKDLPKPNTLIFEKQLQPNLHNTVQPHYIGLFDQPQQHQEEFQPKVPNDFDKTTNNPKKEKEISFEPINDDRPATINKDVISLLESPLESQPKDVARQGDIEIKPEDRNQSDTIQPTPKALSRPNTLIFEKQLQLNLPVQSHYVGLFDQPQQYHEEFQPKVPNNINQTANNPKKEQKISVDFVNHDGPTTLNKDVMPLLESPLEPQPKDVARQKDIGKEIDDLNPSGIIQPTPNALSSSIFEKQLQSKHYLYNSVQPYYAGLFGVPQQYQKKFHPKVPNDIRKTANNPKKGQELSFESLNDDRPTTATKDVMSLLESYRPGHSIVLPTNYGTNPAVNQEKPTNYTIPVPKAGVYPKAPEDAPEATSSSSINTDTDTPIHQSYPNSVPISDYEVKNIKRSRDSIEETNLPASGPKFEGFKPEIGPGSLEYPTLNPLNGSSYKNKNPFRTSPLEQVNQVPNFNLQLEPVINDNTLLPVIPPVSQSDNINNLPIHPSVNNIQPTNFNTLQSYVTYQKPIQFQYESSVGSKIVPATHHEITEIKPVLPVLQNLESSWSFPNNILNLNYSSSRPQEGPLLNTQTNPNDNSGQNYVLPSAGVYSVPIKSLSAGVYSVPIKSSPSQINLTHSTYQLPTTFGTLNQLQTTLPEKNTIDNAHPLWLNGKTSQLTEIKPQNFLQEPYLALNILITPQVQDFTDKQKQYLLNLLKYFKVNVLPDGKVSPENQKLLNLIITYLNTILSHSQNPSPSRPSLIPTVPPVLPSQVTINTVDPDFLKYIFALIESSLSLPEQKEAAKIQLKLFIQKLIKEGTDLSNKENLHHILFFVQNVIKQIQDLTPHSTPTAILPEAPIPTLPTDVDPAFLQYIYTIVFRLVPETTKREQIMLQLKDFIAELIKKGYDIRAKNTLDLIISYIKQIQQKSNTIDPEFLRHIYKLIIDNVPVQERQNVLTEVKLYIDKLRHQGIDLSKPGNLNPVLEFVNNRIFKLVTEDRKPTNEIDPIFREKLLQIINSVHITAEQRQFVLQQLQNYIKQLQDQGIDLKAQDSFNKILQFLTTLLSQFSQISSTERVGTVQPQISHDALQYLYSSIYQHVLDPKLRLTAINYLHYYIKLSLQSGYDLNNKDVLDKLVLFVVGLLKNENLPNLPSDNEILQPKEIEITYTVSVKYGKPSIVKFRVPYSTFVGNVKSLLLRTPSRRSNIDQLGGVLLNEIKITEVSPELQDLSKAELIQLILRSGSFFAARVPDDIMRSATADDKVAKDEFEKTVHELDEFVNNNQNDTLEDDKQTVNINVGKDVSSEKPAS